MEQKQLKDASAGIWVRDQARAAPPRIGVLLTLSAGHRR